MRIEDALTYLKDEAVQRREEGCDVSALEPRIAGVKDLDAAEALMRDFAALSCPNDADEPSDLAGIRAARPKRPPPPIGPIPEARLRDRILGAWLGRCAGCQLGKPVEGWQRGWIQDYLQRAGAWPLAGYIPERSTRPDGAEWLAGCPESTRERIACATRDDDQDYTILALSILEEKGAAFTTADVGQAWLNLLPFGRVYTAERLAYANLVEGRAAPETATRWNPYREWIGAQIRADGWGYAAPGRPELAAELAFRDASLSHVKNGIYGEMYFAAAIAAALAAEKPDPEAVLRTALAEIPAKSRFAGMVRDVLAWHREIPGWEAAWERVRERYGHYHPVHTINNAALVLLGLLYGGNDLGRVICISVAAGWDTDCNGATAGSVHGALVGSKALPQGWISPLRDTVESAVFGFSRCRISELAERTAAVARRIAAP